MAGHFDGEQRVAKDVLYGLPLLADDPQERPVVARAEQHEAAWAGHRLDPGPGPLRVAAPGERPVHVRLEPTESPLERGLHVGEGPVRRHPDAAVA